MTTSTDLRAAILAALPTTMPDKRRLACANRIARAIAPYELHGPEVKCSASTERVARAIYQRIVYAGEPMSQVLMDYFEERYHLTTSRDDLIALEQPSSGSNAEGSGSDKEIDGGNVEPPHSDPANDPRDTDSLRREIEELRRTIKQHAGQIARLDSIELSNQIEFLELRAEQGLNDSLLFDLCSWHEVLKKSLPPFARKHPLNPFEHRVQLGIRRRAAMLESKESKGTRRG